MLDVREHLQIAVITVIGLDGVSFDTLARCQYWMSTVHNTHELEMASHSSGSKSFVWQLPYKVIPVVLLWSKEHQAPGAQGFQITPSTLEAIFRYCICR